jgi:hypothetical protein
MNGGFIDKLRAQHCLRGFLDLVCHAEFGEELR